MTLESTSSSSNFGSSSKVGRKPALKKLYLLINLGTPEAPTSQAIAPFLREFLNDPLVIDIPAFLRWILVNIVIVPRRSKKIVNAYKSIWTERGSPLRRHTEELTQALQEKVESDASSTSDASDIEVRWAMRYGSHNIESALKDIDPHREIKALPLYPQYALSSTQSSMDALKAAVKKLRLTNRVQFLPYFYNDNGFLSAYAEVFKKHAPSRWDHILFSFHGLPLRHLIKIAPAGSPCSLKPNCCDSEKSSAPLSAPLCYRAQCYRSAQGIANKLALPKDNYTVSFQSRLGRAQWIQPYTDMWLKGATGRGVKDLVVLCPSFVADCLETLEEINVRERQRFQDMGGRSLTLIPCLNSDDIWVNAVKNLLTQQGGDWKSL